MRRDQSEGDYLEPDVGYELHVDSNTNEMDLTNTTFQHTLPTWIQGTYVSISSNHEQNNNETLNLYF